MNIPPLVLPAVSPVSLPALVGASPAGAILAQPAIAASSASMVDLSKLSKLLSASSTLAPQPISAGAIDRVAEQDASASLDDGFGKLLAAAQTFVDAFNQFQSDEVPNSQDPLVAPLQNGLSLAMNELPALNSEKPLLASLAQVGIDFQEASNVVGNPQLEIDLTSLQSAFNANPAGTSALLAQAFETIGQLAAQLAAENVDLFLSEDDLALPAPQFDALPALPLVTADGSDVPRQAPQVDQVPLPGQAQLADQAPVTAVAAPLGTASTANLLEPSLAAASTAQAFTANRADDMAADPAMAPITATLNGQTIAANLALSTSQLAAALPAAASPATAVNAADAAPQRSVADQALRNAFEANTMTPPALETAAPAGARPSAVQTQAAADQNLGNLAANPVASSVTNPMAGTAAGIGSIDAQVPVPVPVPVSVPVPVAMAMLDDGRAPLARDPSVAAAVAAYRLGDGAVPTNKREQPGSEPGSDIGAVGKVSSAALDPHDDSSDARRSEAARSAELAENKALAATGFPSQKTVDVNI